MMKGGPATRFGAKKGVTPLTFVILTVIGGSVRDVYRVTQNQNHFVDVGLFLADRG